MNKISKPMIASVLMLSTLGIAGGALAMPYGDGPGNCMRGEYKGGSGHKKGGPGFNIDRMAEHLDLTADQRTQVESIYNESKPQMAEIRKAVQENRVQLRDLMQQDTYNESEVRKLADKQGDLKAEMIVLRTQQRFSIRAVLTEEQRAQMKEMRGKKRRER